MFDFLAYDIVQSAAFVLRSKQIQDTKFNVSYRSTGLHLANAIIIFFSAQRFDRLSEIVLFLKFVTFP